MKRLPVPQIPPDIVNKIRLSVAAGQSQEEVFAMMRRLGLFMGESIKLTSQVYGISLGDAKLAVHFSNTWADCRDATDALHDEAFQAANQLGFAEADAEGSKPQLQSAHG